eukprot:5297310-Ditylum_brightwellii.AAC.1
MLVDIISKCKKQYYGKSVRNIYNGNNDGGKDYNDGTNQNSSNCITGVMSKSSDHLCYLLNCNKMQMTLRYDAVWDTPTLTNHKSSNPEYTKPNMHQI